ncbi:MAG TPA: RNA polymerase sigma factor [Acidimicrobiales bacterium]|nr:RNA polymerase sigma factor [Acidimicrobiales bacterium]
MGDQRLDELVPLAGCDPAAFEQLYRRTVGRVTGFAVRRCTTPEDVADLVAATYLAVIGSAHRFDPARGAALPWVLGIAAHHHANGRRRSGREAAAVGRFAGRSLLDEDDYERLEEQLDAARLAPQLQSAIEALPAGERQVVELTGFEGLSLAAAAAALGIRPATARMRLSRGRRKLRRLLGDDGNATQFGVDAGDSSRPLPFVLKERP